MATSADGFICSKDGGVDWLPSPDLNSPDDFGFSFLLNRVSTIVMGSKSFDQTLTFGDWAWKDKKTVVFTKKKYPENQ